MEKQAARVLVVDDEPGIVEVMALFLVNAGYQVLSAGSGRSGGVTRSSPSVRRMSWWWMSPWSGAPGC